MFSHYNGIEICTNWSDVVFWKKYKFSEANSSLDQSIGCASLTAEVFKKLQLQ